jgi:uncharacterized phage-like protein YoqJ
MVLGITGHRPSKLGGYNDATNKSKDIKLLMKKAFVQAKPACIVSGMALGVDQWAVEVALELGIKVLALIPCLGQDSQWPPAARKKYAQLLTAIVEAGGSVEYVTNEPYTNTCMQLRNQRIVDYATDMFAVWDRSWGGTGSCVRLAKTAGRPVTIIHPTNYEVTHE